MTAQVLHPDIVVHRVLGPHGRLNRPPVLCVDIAVQARDRVAQSCARLGVDHHWHVDLEHGTVEVSVRAGDEFRRAEVISSTPTWVDFGIGIVHLNVVRLLAAKTDLPRRSHAGSKEQ